MPISIKKHGFNVCVPSFFFQVQGYQHCFGSWNWKRQVEIDGERFCCEKHFDETLKENLDDLFKDPPWWTPIPRRNRRRFVIWGNWRSSSVPVKSCWCDHIRGVELDFRLDEGDAFAISFAKRKNDHKLKDALLAAADLTWCWCCRFCLAGGVRRTLNMDSYLIF